MRYTNVIISTKRRAATDERNNQNKIWNWKYDEFGLAVQSWLWVQVEVMAW